MNIHITVGSPSTEAIIERKLSFLSICSAEVYINDINDAYIQALDQTAICKDMHRYILQFVGNTYSQTLLSVKSKCGALVNPLNTYTSIIRMGKCNIGVITGVNTYYDIYIIHLHQGVRTIDKWSFRCSIYEKIWCKKINAEFDHNLVPYDMTYYGIIPDELRTSRIERHIGMTRDEKDKRFTF